MRHFFEARDLSGRVTSVYWAEAEDVTQKAWWEDHIIRRCAEVGGACADDDEEE